MFQNASIKAILINSAAALHLHKFCSALSKQSHINKILQLRGRLHACVQKLGTGGTGVKINEFCSAIHELHIFFFVLCSVHTLWPYFILFSLNCSILIIGFLVYLQVICAASTQVQLYGSVSHVRLALN